MVSAAPAIPMRTERDVIQPFQTYLVMDSAPPIISREGAVFLSQNQLTMSMTSMWDTTSSGALSYVGS
jgi:hypothetical protein